MRTRPVRLTLEALEDRVQPATVVAPDLLTQYDTGASPFDNVTAATQPAFAGTSTSRAGSTITLLIDGAAVASTTLTKGSTSTLRLQPASPLAEGTHVARFRDSSTSTLSNPLTFTIDRTAPAAPAAPTLLDASDPAAVVFRVSGNAGDRLHVVVEGQDLGTLLADGTPQEVALDLSFLDPAQPFDVSTFAQDAAGNTGGMSPVLTAHWTGNPPVAPAAPTNLFLAPASDTGVYDDDRITQLTTISIGGDAEPGTVVTLYVDGIAVDAQFADAGGQFALVTSSLAEGTHTVWVTATNAGGESDPSDAIDILIDGTPPEITDALIDPAALSPNDDGVQDTATFTFTLSEPASVTAYFYDANNISLGAVPLGLLDVGEQTFDLNVAGFLDGSYSIDVVAADLADNIGAIVSTTFIVDRVAPTAPTIALAGPANTNTPTFAGTSDTDTILDFFEGSNYLGSTLAAADGTWSAPVPLADGAHTLTVVAWDDAGNAASTDLVVTIDTSAPVVPINQRPSLGVSSATAPALLEDTANPAGIRVTDLVALLGITDTAGSAAGLAITAADSSHGLWQFAPHGADWTPLGDVADTLARLLAADGVTRLRFVPAADWNGAAALAVRAWDQTDGQANGATASVLSGDSFSSQSATVVQPVSAVNDAPVLQAPPSLSVAHNGSVVLGPLVITDVDATSIRVTVSIDHGTLLLPDVTALTLVADNGSPTITLEGTLAIVSARLSTLTAKPSATFVGTAHIQITVDDLGGTGSGGALTASAVTNLFVVNQPPQKIVSGLSYAMSANQVLNVGAASVAAAFRDGNGDALTFAVLNAPTAGTVTVNADGSFRYVPPAGFAGVAMFSLRAFDGVAWSDPVWITIQVASPTGLRR